MRDLKGSMIICGRRNEPPKCYRCGGRVTVFCDAVVDAWGNTCNFPCCSEHSEQTEGWNKHCCADHIQIRDYSRELATIGRFTEREVSDCINLLIRVGYSADQVKVIMPKAIEITNQADVDLKYTVAHISRGCLAERKNV